MSLPRSAALIFGHGPDSNALRAAFTARSISALSPSATSQIVSPVAGLRVGKHLPETESTHLPPMNIGCCVLTLGGLTRVGAAAVAVAINILRGEKRDTGRDVAILSLRRAQSQAATLFYAALHNRFFGSVGKRTTQKGEELCLCRTSMTTTVCGFASVGDHAVIGQSSFVVLHPFGRKVEQPPYPPESSDNFLRRWPCTEATSRTA